jgi:hypothetical protein
VDAALEGTRHALKSAISTAALGTTPLLFFYLSAFAAAITKTVTKGRPEQNRTTSMASFVIARPNPPTTQPRPIPELGENAANRCLHAPYDDERKGDVY